MKDSLPQHMTFTRSGKPQIVTVLGIEQKFDETIQAIPVKLRSHPRSFSAAAVAYLKDQEYLERVKQFPSLQQVPEEFVWDSVAAHVEWLAWSERLPLTLFNPSQWTPYGV